MKIHLLTPLQRVIHHPRGMIMGEVEIGDDSFNLALLPDGTWKVDDGGVFPDALQVQAEFLRAARTERGWSRADLGTRLGVGARTVESWEQGRSPLPYARAYELWQQLYTHRTPKETTGNEPAW